MITEPGILNPLAEKVEELGRIYYPEWLLGDLQDNLGTPDTPYFDKDLFISLRDDMDHISASETKKSDYKIYHPNKIFYNDVSNPYSYIYLSSSDLKSFSIERDNEDRLGLLLFGLEKTDKKAPYTTWQINQIHNIISKITKKGYEISIEKVAQQSNRKPRKNKLGDTPLETYKAVITSVYDGDTFKCIKDGESIKFRLAGVDAPETKAYDGKWEAQPYSEEAKTALESLILNKEVTIKVIGDTYGRMLAFAFYNDLDISLEMIKGGHAWYYKELHDIPSYQAAQQKAKELKLGLFAQDKPVYPPIHRGSITTGEMDLVDIKYKKGNNFMSINKLIVALGIAEPAQKESGHNYPSTTTNSLPEMFEMSNIAKKNRLGIYSEEGIHGLKEYFNDNKLSGTEYDPITSTKIKTDLNDLNSRSLDKEFERRSKEPNITKIGDVILNIPPTAIEITQLRTTNSVPMLNSTSKASSSPIARVVIKLSCVFNGDDDINQNLKRIMIQYRLNPFNLIKSKDISEKVLSQLSFLDAEMHQNYIPVTMDEYTLETIENHPKCILAQFQFSVFNFHPYFSGVINGTMVDAESGNSSKIDFKGLAYKKIPFNEIDDIIKRTKLKKGKDGKINGSISQSTQDKYHKYDYTFDLEHAIHPYNYRINSYVKDSLNEFIYNNEDPSNVDIVKLKGLDSIPDVLNELGRNDNSTDIDSIISQFVEGSSVSEIATAISIRYENNFAWMPIIGFSHPSAQYIGPGSTFMNVVLRMHESNDNVSKLLNMYSDAVQVEDEGGTNKQFYNDKFLVLSAFSKFAFCTFMSISDVSVRSVPSHPGTVDLNLMFEKQEFAFNALTNNPVAEQDDYWSLNRLILPFLSNDKIAKAIEKLSSFERSDSTKDNEVEYFDERKLGDKEETSLLLRDPDVNFNELNQESRRRFSDLFNLMNIASQGTINGVSSIPSGVFNNLVVTRCSPVFNNSSNIEPMKVFTQFLSDIKSEFPDATRDIPGEREGISPMALLLRANSTSSFQLSAKFVAVEETLVRGGRLDDDIAETVVKHKEAVKKLNNVAHKLRENLIKTLHLEGESMRVYEGQAAAMGSKTLLQMNNLIAIRNDSVVNASLAAQVGNQIISRIGSNLPVWQGIWNGSTLFEASGASMRLRYTGSYDDALKIFLFFNLHNSDIPNDKIFYLSNTKEITKASFSHMIGDMIYSRLNKYGCIAYYKDPKNGEYKVINFEDESWWRAFWLAGTRVNLTDDAVSTLNSYIEFILVDKSYKIDVNAISENVNMASSAFSEQLKDIEIPEASVVKPFSAHRYFPAIDGFIARSSIESSTLGDWYFDELSENIDFVFSNISRSISESISPFKNTDAWNTSQMQKTFGDNFIRRIQESGGDVSKIIEALTFPMNRRETNIVDPSGAAARVKNDMPITEPFYYPSQFLKNSKLVRINKNNPFATAIEDKPFSGFSDGLWSDGYFNMSNNAEFLAHARNSQTRIRLANFDKESIKGYSGKQNYSKRVLDANNVGVLTQDRSEQTVYGNIIENATSISDPINKKTYAAQNAINMAFSGAESDPDVLEKKFNNNKNNDNDEDGNKIDSSNYILGIDQLQLAFRDLIIRDFGQAHPRYEQETFNEASITFVEMFGQYFSRYLKIKGEESDFNHFVFKRLTYEILRKALMSVITYREAREEFNNSYDITKIGSHTYYRLDILLNAKPTSFSLEDGTYHSNQDKDYKIDRVDIENIFVHLSDHKILKKYEDYTIDNYEDFTMEDHEINQMDLFDGNHTLTPFMEELYKELKNSKEIEVSRDIRKSDDTMASRFIENMLPTFGMENAFPTYKMYIIKSDTSDLKYSSMDDYYDFRLVQDLMVIRSKDSPVHILKARVLIDHKYITLSSNVFQKLNKRNSPTESQIQDAMLDGTSGENFFNKGKIPLREGMRICVKLGYHSDPRLLDTVFIGTIESLSPAEGTVYYLEAKGDGRELTVPAGREAKNVKGENFHEILSTILKANPSVIHFGKTYGSFLERISRNYFWLLAFSKERPDLFKNLLHGGIGAGAAATTTGGMILTSRFLSSKAVMLGSTALRVGAVGAGVTAGVGAVYYLSNKYANGLGGGTQNMFDLFHRSLLFANKDNIDRYGTAFTYLSGRYWGHKFDGIMNFMKGNTFDIKKSSTQISGILYQTLALNNDPIDDNIFAPDIWVSGPKSSISLPSNYSKTIWDVLVDVKRLYPGFALDVRPYGNRSTIFLGPLTFNYWRTDDPLQAMAPQLYQSSDAGFQKRDSNVADVLDGQFSRDITGQITASSQNFDRMPPFIPFQKFISISSDCDILVNDIRSTPYRGWNQVTVSYSKNGRDDAEPMTQAIPANASIEPSSLIDKFVITDWTNDPETAKSYALGVLKEGVEKLYGGTLTIRGNPKIEPYDKILITDKVNKMFGWIEVETVIHKFDLNNGFVTHITPNMVCSVNRDAYTTSGSLWRKWAVNNLGSVIATAGAGAVIGSLIAGSAIAATAMPLLFVIGAFASGYSVYNGYKGVMNRASAIMQKGVTDESGSAEITSNFITTTMMAETLEKSMRFGYVIGLIHRVYKNNGLSKIKGIISVGWRDTTGAATRIVKTMATTSQGSSATVNAYRMVVAMTGNSSKYKDLNKQVDSLKINNGTAEADIATRKELLKAYKAHLEDVKGELSQAQETYNARAQKAGTLVDIEKMEKELGSKLKEIDEMEKRIKNPSADDLKKLNEAKTQIQRVAHEADGTTRAAQKAGQKIANQSAIAALTPEERAKLPSKIKTLTKAAGFAFGIFAMMGDLAPSMFETIMVNSATGCNAVIIYPLWIKSSLMLGGLEGYKQENVYIHMKDRIISTFGAMSEGADVVKNWDPVIFSGGNSETINQFIRPDSLPGMNTSDITIQNGNQKNFLKIKNNKTGEVIELNYTDEEIDNQGNKLHRSLVMKLHTFRKELNAVGLDWIKTNSTESLLSYKKDKTHTENSLHYEGKAADLTIIEYSRSDVKASNDKFKRLLSAYAIAYKIFNGVGLYTWYGQGRGGLHVDTRDNRSTYSSLKENNYRGGDPVKVFADNGLSKDEIISELSISEDEYNRKVGLA